MQKRTQQIQHAGLRHYAREHGSGAQTMQNSCRAALASALSVCAAKVAEGFKQRGMVRHQSGAENHAQQCAEINLAGRQVPIDRG